jgi:hypothetical protein
MSQSLHLEAKTSTILLTDDDYLHAAAISGWPDQPASALKDFGTGSYPLHLYAFSHCNQLFTPRYMMLTRIASPIPLHDLVFDRIGQTRLAIEEM